MKNLKQLLGICEHKWVILRQIVVHSKRYNILKNTRFEYDLQCEKCGDIKKIRNR